MKSLKTYALISILFVIAIIFGCAQIDSIEDSARHWEMARQAALDGVKKGSLSGEKYLLRAVPSLTAASKYDLGSVFLAESYPLRYTDSCLVGDAVESEKLEKTVKFYSGGNFQIFGELPSKLIKAINGESELRLIIKNDTKIEYGYDVSSSQTIDIDQIDESILSEQCLAKIANRPIWYLAGRISAKEVYSSTSKVSNGAKATLLKNAKLEVLVENNNTFKILDSQPAYRIWIFYPYQINIPNFDSQELLPIRLAMAREFLGQFQGRDIESKPFIPNISESDLDIALQGLGGEVQLID